LALSRVRLSGQRGRFVVLGYQRTFGLRRWGVTVCRPGYVRESGLREGIKEVVGPVAPFLETAEQVTRLSLPTGLH
jgi:hypothetical protein